MSFELEMEQELSQQLSQFQIQSLKILSFDNYEMEQFLQNEFAENPMLEYQPSDKEFFVRKGARAVESQMQQPEIADQAPKDPKSFFMEQLNPKHYTKVQWEIMGYMAECLEDSGLLRIPLESIGKKFGVSVEEVDNLRRILTQLEPPGVFAVHLAECLKLQLEREEELNEDLQCIIEEHLEDIALGKLSVISRKLRISTAQVRKYIFKIQQLNPRPFFGASWEASEYIVPDIIIEWENGEGRIYLNDSWIGDYSINDYYVKMMEQAQDSQLKEYFQKKYERCRWIIESIEQRRETLLKISGAMLERQQDYFKKGGKLKPMTMQNIADDIKMHVSTVSRAVKGKYIQYPYGTVSLREIFGVSYTFGSQECTSEDMKDMIRRIIGEEDGQKPVSDQKIAAKLEKKGVKISRRTVAKYRIQMGIPGAYERKDLIKN